MKLFKLYRYKSKIVTQTQAGNYEVTGYQDDYYFCFAKYKTSGAQTYACLSTFKDKIGWHRINYQQTHGKVVSVNELPDESKEQLIRDLFIMKSWYTLD